MRKERIYVCHTFYHVYIAVLKECNLPMEKRGGATLVLSTMSNDFGNLKERAQKCGLFEAVLEYHEKEDTYFPQLQKYHVDRGNIVVNMLARMKYTKLLGKLQASFVPVDFKEYKDVYVFCDSDPIGYYLSYKKIYYHALEDGLDCIKYYDTARYDNRGHFELKAKLASWNWIFIQNGYGKYCLDMEVNNISCLPYPCKKYIEKPREELVAGIREEDKHLIVEVFMENVDALMEQIEKKQEKDIELDTVTQDGMGNKVEQKKSKVLLLTEPLCDLQTRERLFRDIIQEYASDAQVFIKPHPRDVLDYKALFDDHIVIEGKFPMEVMNFIPGIRWNKVITVFTVPDSIKNTDEVLFLGEDFMDKYEAPELHRQNESI
ncbi:MAG: lipooligosaccharide sialyltransferase [Lachnospiraceae bacterium]|nr:lipooligosaccharide sialyltransferase [Lachnospiraceae bacterium]